MTSTSVAIEHRYASFLVSHSNWGTISLSTSRLDIHVKAAIRPLSIYSPHGCMDTALIHSATSYVSSIIFATTANYYFQFGLTGQFFGVHFLENFWSKSSHKPDALPVIQSASMTEKQNYVHTRCKLPCEHHVSLGIVHSKTGYYRRVLPAHRMHA